MNAPARLRDPRRGWAWRAIRLTLIALAASCAFAQDQLKSAAGYSRYQKLSREIHRSVKSGSLSVTWQEEGAALEYRWDGKRYRYDIDHRLAIQLGEPVQPKTSPDAKPPAATSPPQEHPDRGRQYTSALSPDGRWKACHRQRNVWLSDPDGGQAFAITSDGSEFSRVKYGTANWVYGEELEQRTALWWAPNSNRLAFYRFDESQIRDYYLTLDETQIQNRLDVEPYMKAGTPNPTVDLHIYHLDSRRTVIVDVRDGQPFGPEVAGHYVYGIAWTADGQELLFHRTNRRQNLMELCAADPDTGRTRVILRESWPASWTENLPPMRFLADGRRFLWTSERTGWRNLYLYDLTGALLATLTAHEYEVGEVVRVDETRGLVWYTAHDGDNPMKLQLHRVGLDGQGDRRLTDPAFHHTVNVAPDSRHFVDIAQTHDQPPTTRLCDAEGRLVAELARSDLTRFRQLHLKPVERFTFKAADGVTDLYGLLHFPSRFHPGRKYPLLVSVYAGPATVGARETFVYPDVLTELGFLVASFDSRSASGRGKRFLDAIYLKLGQVEVDDQAAGVKALCQRPYVDRRRVGMFGTSYGGTVSATSLLRYPDVFQAACANSAVTDYRNYDTIYAERYMATPQENGAGYDAARVMTYATNLHGRLLIFYGTADNNVHPANSLQLIQALQRAGKSFEVQVGPDVGHAALNRDRMMEFFVENLIRHPVRPYRPPPPTPAAPAGATTPKRRR